MALFKSTANKPMALALSALALAALAPAAQAWDSTSLEWGTGNRTRLLRAGVQWETEQKFFQSNGTHVGMYLEATAAVWRGMRHNNVVGATKDWGDIGFTPVFRFQADSKTGPYFDIGVGYHLMSGGLYSNNGRRFSTAFEFGNQLGFGWKLENGLDVNIKIQHFSNASIKQPNNGANFVVAGIGKRF